MSIVRVIKDKNNPYLLMNKTCIDDKRLSFQATGLLAYLLSKPDNWYICYQNLVSAKTNGIRSITSSIKELIKFGYIHKHHLRNSKGQYRQYEYLVYEKPRIPTSIKTPLQPKSRFPILDNVMLLNNNIKINNKTTATAPPDNSGSSKSNPLKPAAVDYCPSNEKITVTKLLKELNVNNLKNIFSEFHLSDLFKYATWIKERNPKMKNPTGFLITAIKEKWLDYEPKNNSPGLRVFFAQCSTCLNHFAYEEYNPKYTECINCRNEKQPIFSHNS